MSKAPLTLTSFPSLSLADLDATWTMSRRYDTKFIMERSAIDRLLTQAPTNFGVLEIAGQNEFTYQTTYFDTPDLLLYRDHAQRRSRRVKVRTRHYVESNRIRLEVKAKLGNGQTHKTLFEGRSSVGLAEISMIDEVIAKIHPTPRYTQLASRLTQSAVTTFKRSTLINRDSVERITIDSYLTLDSNQKRMALSPDLVLVEIKSTHPISETVRQLRRLGFHPTSFSKYCAGIEATRDIPPRIHSTNLLSNNLCLVS